VALSETPVPRPPRPPLPELELVKRSKEQPEAMSEEATSEACSASDTASVDSAAKAKLQKLRAEGELEKVVSSNAPKKERTMAPEEAREEAEQAQGWRRCRDRAREVVVTLRTGSSIRRCRGRGRSIPTVLTIRGEARSR
jgi:hypothetical protein